MTDPVETPIPPPPDPAELKERARLLSELEAALETNIKEAEFLAGEALANSRLPLVSARWSKPQLESNSLCTNFKSCKVYVTTTLLHDCNMTFHVQK